MDLEFLDSLRHGLTVYLILVASIGIHEWAHAFTADLYGDPTPRSMGRVTLNPIAHIDLVGTVILPLVMILISPGFAVFGWGKAVITNPRKYRNYVQGDIVVSMAGPASNLLMASLLSLIGGLLVKSAPASAELFMLGIWINCMLAIFNLIPIPPLDGSHVLRHIVNMSEMAYMQFSRWGFIILLIAINVGPVRAILFHSIEWAYQNILTLFIVSSQWV